MSILFSEIEDAFLFVSSAPMYTNQATLCKESGEIVYSSDYSDGAEDKIPDEPINHKGKAKSYQVKQVLLALEKLEVNHGIKK